MKKNKKTTLSAKIVFLLLGVFAGINALGTTIGLFILRGRVGTMDSYTFRLLVSVGVTTIALISLIVFAIFVQRMIVNRIKILNEAVNEVVKGDYSININVSGNDELSNLTANFNKMISELRANEYLSKDFARNVSHEYKTPLSIMRAYAETLERQTSDERAKEKLNVIIGETDRLSAMSKSILELASLDSTTIIKQQDDFNPAEQIRTILQTMQPLWEAKSIIFNLELEDYSVISNEALLYTVWQNLINNAIKFSNNGGEIYIMLQIENGRLIFEIVDNGIGISDEEKEKIFSRFFVGDRSRNSEGSGLGLPLARKIIEKLGGSMKVESKLKTGTKFTVSFPIILKEK